MARKARDWDDITTLPSSKTEAQEKRIKYFYTGKPCAQDHTTYRYTSTGLCADCAGVQLDAWQKRKKDRAVKSVEISGTDRPKPFVFPPPSKTPPVPTTRLKRFTALSTEHSRLDVDMKVARRKLSRAKNRKAPRSLITERQEKVSQIAERLSDVWLELGRNFNCYPDKDPDVTYYAVVFDDSGRWYLSVPRRQLAVCLSVRRQITDHLISEGLIRKEAWHVHVKPGERINVFRRPVQTVKRTEKRKGVPYRPQVEGPNPLRYEPAYRRCLFS